MKRAADVMNRNPLTVGGQLSVSALARTLLDHRAEGALVMEGEHLVGVVTATDLAMQELDRALSAHADPMAEEQNRKRAATTVQELMTANPVSAAPDTPMHEVAGWMTRERFSMVPVVDGEELVGVITRRTIIEAAAGGGLAIRSELVKDP